MAARRRVPQTPEDLIRDLIDRVRRLEQARPGAGSGARVGQWRLSEGEDGALIATHATTGTSTVLAVP